MKKAHLSDKEIYSMLIEPETVNEQLQLHLKKCENCRKRLNRITEFTNRFNEQIVHNEIDWTKERRRVLSAIFDSRQPLFRWRWGTAVILSCIIIISAFLVRHIYIQPNHDIKVEEAEFQKGIWIFAEDWGEVELPQSIILLAEWEKEDFRQFLNFFSPIEEENDEKKDVINDSLSNNGVDQFLCA